MFVFIVIILLLLLYFYSTKNHDYWKKRNVKHDPPIPLFGNHFRNLFGITSMSDIAFKLYHKYPNENVIGYYRGCIPELIVKDLEIIKYILNADFEHFYRRGVGRNSNIEPLMLNIFSVEGDSWKLLRHRLTPAFTTAKLKNMFPLVVNCAEKLQTVVGEQIQKGDVQDVREIMARFTTEFIAACGFGIDMDTINNEQSLYRDFGKSIFVMTYAETIRLGLYDVVPELRNIMYVGNRKVENIIYEIVTKVCEQRNHKPSGRHDFIDLLLELEAKGKIQGESIEYFDQNGDPLIVDRDLDFKTIVAQAFVFFAAGFETSSTATSHTLHQLAFNPDIQSRVQDEIDRVLTKYGDKLCYDAVAEMPLLNMAFKEGMRMLAPLGVLTRECTKKYTIPGLNISIDPGVKIMIPVQAIHMDERYYDSPEKFKPERFVPEELKARHNCVYLPFGEGPRICIGSRLGEMQSLTGLAAFLHKFSVTPALSTQRSILFEPKSVVVQTAKGGFPLKITPRNKI